MAWAPPTMAGTDTIEMPQNVYSVVMYIMCTNFGAFITKWIGLVCHCTITPCWFTLKIGCFVYTFRGVLSCMNAKLPLGCCLTPTHVLCYPLHIECYTHACVLYTHTATPILLLPDPVPMHRVHAVLWKNWTKIKTLIKRQKCKL